MGQLKAARNERLVVSDHIRQTEQYFWRAVESRLDVCIYSLTFVACGTEIDDLDDGTFEAAGTQR